MGQTSKTGSRTAVQIAEDAPKPLGAYSHAVIAGDLVFVAGQGARKARTGKEAGVVLDHHQEVVAYDISVQTRAVIKNLKTVLAASSCTLEDVVDVTVFLKDMKDFDEYNKVYGEFFSFANPPARTTVQVAGLPGKNYIEIKAIAYRAREREEREKE